MNTDTLSYSVPGYRTRTHRRSQHIITIFAAILALILGLAAGWTAHALITTETPQPTPPATTPATQPAQNSPMREGTDYALTHTPTGNITRWNCSKSITVALAGPVPEGAAGLLTAAVNTLATDSHLPLHTGPDADTADDAPGTITVRYVSQLPHTPDPDAIGLGGTSHTTTGDIDKGNVWLLNSSPANIPSTPQARTVLLHELMHALGADHAAPGTPELMAPATTETSPTDPGPGDIIALKTLGCPGP